MTVILKSQNGEDLGETQILYVDEEKEKQQQVEIIRQQVEKEFAQRVVREPELQLRLFKEWTSYLGGNSENRRSDTTTSGSIGR